MDVESRWANPVQRRKRSRVDVVGQRVLVEDEHAATPMRTEHAVAYNVGVVYEYASACIRSLVAARLGHCGEVLYIDRHDLVARAAFSGHCKPGVVGISVRIGRHEM